MLEKIRSLENRYEELCFQSEQADFYADPKKAARLLREKNDLQPIVETFTAYNTTVTEMADALELMSDPEMKEFCQETYQAAKQRQETAAFFSALADYVRQHGTRVVDGDRVFGIRPAAHPARLRLTEDGAVWELRCAVEMTES